MNMTVNEYIAFSSLIFLTVLFFLFLLAVNKKYILSFFINGISGIGIYALIIMLEVYEPSRLSSFIVGSTGLFGVISLIFIG